MGLKIKWKDIDGVSRSMKYSLKNSVYGTAQVLENGGATDIKIYSKGVLIDHYVQGRSTRNLPSVSDPVRQLELF
jgi:hypothetical protein